jgi:hypothetical protein
LIFHNATKTEEETETEEETSLMGITWIKGLHGLRSKKTEEETETEEETSLMGITWIKGLHGLRKHEDSLPGLFIDSVLESLPGQGL